MARRRTARWTGTEQAIEAGHDRAKERSNDEILVELIEEWPQMFAAAELGALQAGAEAIRRHPTLEAVIEDAEKFVDRELTQQELEACRARVLFIKGAL